MPWLSLSQEIEASKRGFAIAKSILTGAFAVTYPFIHGWLSQSGFGFVFLWLFGLVCLHRALRSKANEQRLIWGCVAILLAIGSTVAEHFTAKLIPAFIYLSLAFLFGYTLRNPPCLMERMVRLQFPEFKPGIAEYLKQLTWIWTGFFGFNVVVCATLAALPESGPWTFYTGFLVYLMMVLLVLSEMWYRPRRFPDLEIPPAIDSFKVLIRDSHKVFRDLR